MDQNPNALTDDELISIADDPSLRAKLTPEERGRLSVLQSANSERQGGPVARFVENAIQPLAQAPGMIKTMLTDPKAAGAAIVNPSAERLQMAADANREGRPAAAVGNVLAATPIIGPAIAHGIDQMQSGDVAGGAGTMTGIAAPFVAGPLARGGASMLKGTSLGEGLADAADASANRRMVDTIVPKVGPNKLRMGNQAVDVAPKLLRDPDLSAYSRSGLADKIGAKLDSAIEGLDAAADNRGVSTQVKTGPLLKQIDSAIGDLTAQPVEGSHKTPVYVGDAARQVPVDKVHQYALRWMKDDMDNLPFVKHTFNEQLHHGGDLEIVPGSAGAKVYDAIIGSEDQRLIQATRGEVRQAINDVLEGNTDGRLRQLVVGVADKLAQGDYRTMKMMETSGPLPREEPSVHTLRMGTGKPADLPDRAGAPLGQSVEPAPNRAQLDTLKRMRDEVAALGPVADYEAVRRIRSAWDQVAKVKYSPAVSPDYLAKQGEATGAAKGTSAMREALANADSGTAQANETYHLYKTANDVIQAAEQADRVRPNRGRGIMARTAGAMIGAESGGAVGAGIGAMVATIADKAAEMAPTFQIAIARRLAAVADALRAGETETAQALVDRTVARFPAVKTTLKITGKMTPAMASGSGLPLAAGGHEKTP